MNIYETSKIRDVFLKPISNTDLNEWLELKKVIPYLESEINDEYIILNAISRHLFLYSIFISNIEFTDEKIKDLLKWSGNSYTSWSIESTSSGYELYEPNIPFRSDNLLEVEHIIFSREFEGVKGYEDYYEINQKIIHALGLHFLQERKAWCQLDKKGDIEESIKEIDIKLSDNDSLKVVCVNKKLLSKYAQATDQILLRMIDCSAFGDDFYGWREDREYIEVKTKVTYGTMGRSMPIGSYFRGIQLIDLTYEALSLLKEENEENCDYVDLIANDFKHQTITTISCSPENLDNYFVDTGKPFAMSPAFFNAEVLRKYKSDTEKYTIRNRSIECRGTWYLRAFDINDVGQISVYLVDFNKLPYSEQLHWKQYNEKPKASISNRAFQTDFKGQFTDDILPLDRLKHLLSKMNEMNLEWWKLRDKDNLNKLQYPLTQSKDEWAEELLTLDQIIIEGFEEKWLKKKAKELNPNIENKYRALKLTEYILIAKDFEPQYASEIMSVFHEVHNLRSEVKGHSSGNTAEEKRKLAIQKYGSYRAHFDNLSNRMYESLEILLDELN